MSDALRYETCSECGEDTGRAGRGDDSIFTDDGVGPLCTQCWAAIQPDAAIKLRRELAAVTQKRDALCKELAEARRQVDVIAQECVALRRAMAEMYVGLEAVHLKYQHLDWLRQKKDLDPWHECVRDFMVAVAAATGYEPKDAQTAKEGGK